MLKEICKFVLDMGLGPPWQRDINFFAGHVPLKNKNGDEVPERYMAVLENAGGAVDFYLPDRVDKAVQILNRAKTYFTARADAQEVYEAIHGTAGWELAAVDEAGWTAMTIEAYSVPAPIENPGEKRLYVFSANYIVRLENP